MKSNSKSKNLPFVQVKKYHNSKKDIKLNNCKFKIRNVNPMLKLEKEKEDRFINSESTRDQKISTVWKIDELMMDCLLKKEEFIKFNDSDSNSVSKLTRKSYSKVSDINKSKRSKFLTNKFFAKESKTSNYLNLELGEIKDMTTTMDQDPNLNNITILSERANVGNILNIGLDDSLNSDFSNNNLGSPENGNLLSISKITDRKFSSDRKIFSTKRLFRIKVSPNISILSSDIFMDSDDENYSDYDSDTEEFNNDSEKKINKVYNMKIHDNNLKTHLDIPNLNFILRFLFHQSEILTEVKK
jgi:hypothetical protein